jgi:hypothetical protein
MRTALGPPQLARIEFPLAKLPRTLDGTRLAVVSDIHLGALTGLHHVDRIVDVINSVNADIVCVVGDLVDGTVEELGRFAEPLAGIRSRHGAYFVTGNHEYYSGFAPWVDEVARLGLRPLRNQRVELGGLDLAGVNDLNGTDFGDAPDFAKALGNRDTYPAGGPDGASADRRARGGAVRRGPAGLRAHARRPDGAVQSRGTDGTADRQRAGPGGRRAGLRPNGAGFWGPPVRVGAPPQVSVIDLRAVNAIKIHNCSAWRGAHRAA